MSVELVTGDLVEVLAANILSLARVRSIDGDRVHLALEQGGFVPWVEESVLVRRCADEAERWDARVVYSGASTVTLEMLGRSPAPPPSIPEAADTERDLDPPPR